MQEPVVTNINDYCNGLIIEFLDRTHTFLRDHLHRAYGDEWFERGVARHIDAKSLDRTRKMLSAPLRVVDMEKRDEELYGIEHLRNVVDGEWRLFEATFGDRDRVKVYLADIAEVRHNLSHRRGRHILSRPELFRCVTNCHVLLRAMSAAEAAKFQSIAEQMTAGESPWGIPMAGDLPHSDTVVSDFVGRSEQLEELFEWFATDSSRCLLWGDGGAGKSAIAFEFARRVRDAGDSRYLATCWVTAKSSEFVEGQTRQRSPDFTDVPTAARAIRRALYSEEIIDENNAPSDLLRELREIPSFVVIDDLDAILTNEKAAEFLTYDLTQTSSKFLFTSRQRVPGIRTVEVKGFPEQDLLAYLTSRSIHYRLNSDEVLGRSSTIRKVTAGYPLFVDDLLRLAVIVPLKTAIEDWGQRKGDAAREYALRRQLERLAEAAREVLMAIALSRRPLSAIELGPVTGRSDEDVETAVRSLADWYLINRVVQEDATPAFNANENTKRLVMKTFVNTPAWNLVHEALKAQAPEVRSLARSQAIGSLIGQAAALILRGDVDRALATVQEGLKGDLEEEPDLVSACGWVYTRTRPPMVEAAREAFEKAHSLGSRKIETYKHWVVLERHHAEEDDRREQGAPDAWIRVYSAAEKGLERLGNHMTLRYYAGLGRGRNASRLARAFQFDRSRAEYAKAAVHFKEALACETDENWWIDRRAVYRGVVIALEGLEHEDDLRHFFEMWFHEFPSDAAALGELDRMCGKFQTLARVDPR